MTAMNNRTKISRATEYALISFLACGCDILGRLLFPNYDINYLIYGANYVNTNKLPWMDVWTGIDLIYGSLSFLATNAENAVLLASLAFNITAALVVNAIMRRYRCERNSRIAAVVATALFFQPTLGGWSGDHLSFLVGLAPALVFVFHFLRYTNCVPAALGICLAIGLTLKLNSFFPTYTLSFTWILLASVVINRRSIGKRKFRSLWTGAVIFAVVLSASMLIISALVPIQGGIYPSILKTYGLVSASTASGQFSLNRFLRLPLQIDMVDALANLRPGAILFMPLVAFFWFCLVISLYRLTNKDTSPSTKEKTYVGLLLIAATAIATIGLGRGLSHRLFFLPAGLLLIIDTSVFQRRFLNQIPTLIAVYLAFAWISLAYVQKDLEWKRYYNLRGITANRSKVSQLCLQDKYEGRARSFRERSSSAEILYIKKIGGSDNISNRCWNASQAREEISGFVNVEEVANTMGFVFRNHEPAKGDYVEKWDWRKTQPSFRHDWALKQASWINKNKVPYFVERLLIMREEYNVPGYFQNIVPRQEQLSLLVKETNSTAIGKLGAITLWRTQWASPSNQSVKASNDR